MRPVFTLLRELVGQVHVMGQWHFGPLLLSQNFIMVIGMTFLIEKFQKQFRKLDILRNNGTYLGLDNHSSTPTDGPD